MTDPAAPDDQSIFFDFDFFDSASSEVVPEQDFFHNLFPSVPVYNSDVPASSPHDLTGRSQSFGQQSSTPPGELSVPPGGPRRRAQSDNTSFPSIRLHAANDTFALDDDDSPASDLPPIGPHPGPRNTQWAIRDSAQQLSPLSSSPGLLSPWSTGPTSDASSIGSVSPSPSRSGFPSPSFLSAHESSAFRAGRSPDLFHHRLQNDDPYGLREEPTIRGRLARRDKPHGSRNPSVASSVGVPFEHLSIEDNTSAAGSRYSGDYASLYPHSPAQSSSSQPEFSWTGEGSTLMPRGAYGHSPGSSAGSIRSLSSLSSNYRAFEADVLNLTGHSSDAGHSRSHSRAPDVDADVEHLAGLHGHGNSGRMTTSTHRRRHSPYPVAGPSTSLGEGGGARDSYINDFMDRSRLGADPSSPSASSLSSWNAGQSSQEDQGAQAYRAVVATPATRRASNRRRKDPGTPGAHVCEYCGNDFTALHNLKFHLKSHLSIKDHECELCGQRFVTPQVLQRHKRTCSTPVSESPVKKKRKRPT